MCSALCYSLICFYLYSLEQSLYPLSTTESHPKFIIMVAIPSTKKTTIVPNKNTKIDVGIALTRSDTTRCLLLLFPQWQGNPPKMGLLRTSTRKENPRHNVMVKTIQVREMQSYTIWTCTQRLKKPSPITSSFSNPWGQGPRVPLNQGQKFPVPCFARSPTTT